MAWEGKTRGKPFRLTEDRVRWDITKKFFPVRVVKYQHRLSRAAVAISSLKVFQGQV